MVFYYNEHTDTVTIVTDAVLDPLAEEFERETRDEVEAVAIELAQSFERIIIAQA